MAFLSFEKLNQIVKNKWVSSNCEGPSSFLWKYFDREISKLRIKVEIDGDKVWNDEVCIILLQALSFQTNTT